MTGLEHAKNLVAQGLDPYDINYYSLDPKAYDEKGARVSEPFPRWALVKGSWRRCRIVSTIDPDYCCSFTVIVVELAKPIDDVDLFKVRPYDVRRSPQ
jgi:hypothetical protein